MGSSSTSDPAHCSWNSLLQGKRAILSRWNSHSQGSSSEQHTETLSLRCEVKSGPLTRAGICEITGASRGEKARPQRCHQTGRYNGDYGHICNGFTVTEENILHQALLFPVWEKARNCHYLSSIILAADKEREYHASLLSALLALTDLSTASLVLCLLADTSTGQVLEAFGGSKFTTSERQPEKPH